MGGIVIAITNEIIAKAIVTILYAATDLTAQVMTIRGVSLSSPSYLVRNPNQALHLEKTHETPPSSRDEGLLFLHGLESNPESSLQTPQEA